MTKKRTYGRGVLRLESFKPCRRPGQAPDPNCVAQPICTTSEAAEVDTRATVKTNGDGDDRRAAAKEQTVPIPPVQCGKSPVEMLARYSYQANPDRPGGFEEMSVKQGQKLEFIRAHPSNPFWWEARNEVDEVAFVPASYMVVLEKKVSALPWLENKALEEEKEQQGQEKKNVESRPAAFKQYSSAYAKDSSGQPQSSKEFYCDVCYKQLNGLKPYQAHMVSKGHKEELALLE